MDATKLYSTRSRGMTLVEVLYSLGLVTLFTGGVLATMLYSRRTSEFVVRQNIAIEVAQGYSEQIKNMSYNDLILSPATQAEITANPTYYVVKTQKDELTTDYLTLSPGTPPALDSIDAGTATSPNARAVPVNPMNNNLLAMNMKFWIWVADCSVDTNNQIKMVSIIYAYEVPNGSKTKWHKGTVKSMRSLVPTF